MFVLTRLILFLPNYIYNVNKNINQIAYYKLLFTRKDPNTATIKF